MNDYNDNKTAIPALIFGIAVLGFSAIFIQMADAPGIVSVFYRMFIGSVVVGIPFFINRKKHTYSRKGVVWAILAGLFFGVDLSFFATGIVIGGATIPTLMSNTAPLWVGLGSFLFFKEKSTKWFWVGIVLAFVGMVSVVGLQTSLVSSTIGRGAVLGLISGLFYSGFYLVAQKGRGLIDTLSFFWISTTSSAALLLVVSLIKGYSLTGYSTKTIWVFVGLGLVIQVFGWVLVNYAQGHVPAYIVSPTLLGQPVLTAVWARLLFNEQLSFIQIVGGILVLSGILVIHGSRNSHTLRRKMLL